MPLSHPLDKNHARKLISQIVSSGVVNLDLAGTHLGDEAAADGLDASDVMNVLRGGQIYEEGEEARPGVWRYRVHTQKLGLVVQFMGDDELTVVTIWRKRGK